MPARKPLTDTELRAVENKRKVGLEGRLLETINVLRNENANLQLRLKSAAAPTPTLEETKSAENAFETREKVLIVIHGDGYVQAYAERWIDVRFVELWPWEDEEDLELPETFAAIHFPSKVRNSGMPRLTRPAGFAETCLRFVQWREQAERNGALVSEIKETLQAIRATATAP
jgi:hypothetical protein